MLFVLLSESQSIFGYRRSIYPGSEFGYNQEAINLLKHYGILELLLVRCWKRGLSLALLVISEGNRFREGHLSLLGGG